MSLQADIQSFAGEQTVEHWDTTEKVALRSEWNNENGKF